MLAFEPLAPGGNTFTGGIKVEGGTVRADVAGAFGMGDVTVSAESGVVQYGSGYQSGVTTYTEFTNSINVTVNNTGRTVTFFKNTIIRGNITGTARITLRHDNGSTSSNAGQAGPSAAIYGTVQTPGTLYFRSLGTFAMHGPVKGNVVYGGDSNSGTGTTELYDSGNEIGKYIISHDILSLKTANALPGALIEWRPCCTQASSGRSKVLLNGYDQTFAAMQFCYYTGNWVSHAANTWGHVRYDTGDRVAFSSSGTPTITLTGIANTNCPSYMKIRDRISLVIDAASAPGFVQEFHYHPNPTAGDIEVRAGTLSITNGASFGSVQSVTVGANGILLVTASTNTFAQATNLVVNGRFSCADNVVTPFASLENLEIGSGATFTLPADCTVRTQRFKQNGTTMPNGSYQVGGGTVVVTGEILLTEVTEFNVPEGVTNVVSRRVTGAGGIRKTGAGYLLLSNKGNDFAGGVAIAQGTVLVAATNALGTGTVSITATGTGVRQLRFIADSEISNPITQEGESNDSYPSLYFEKDVTTVLKGSFTGNSNVFFWNEQKASSGTFPAPGPMTIFDCTVTVPTSPTRAIWLRTYGEFHFKKKVTALSIIGQDSAETLMRYSEGGKVFLYSPENVLSRVNAYSPYVICEADNVLGGSAGRIEFKSSDWSNGGVRFDLKGHSQTTKSISTAGSQVAKVLQGADAFHAINSSSGSPTLTITGDSADRTTYAGINDAISLTLNNVTGYSDFWQTFSGKSSKMTGALTVTKGTLKIMNGAGFPNASSVTVGSAGQIVLDSTTTDAFKNVPTLTVDGKLQIRASATTPFFDGETSLALSDTATITIPTNMVLNFKTMTTNGVIVPAGSRLDKNTMPGVIAGDGSIMVSSESASVWTGEGAGDSVWTPGNWSDPSVVDRLGAGSVLAKFGTGGRAETDRALALGGIQFEGDDFTLAGDGAVGTTLSLNVSGVQVAKSATAHTYTIKDMGITQEGVGEHVWEIPSNQTVRVKDGLVSVPGTIKVSGVGNLTLEGTNTFAGGITMTAANKYPPMLTVRGLLATPNHADQGRPAANDGKSIYFDCNQDIPYVDRMLCLSNAVVEKPVAIRAYMGRTSIFSHANTTNELRGRVRYMGAWHKVGAGSNSETIFSGGVEAEATFRYYGGGSTLRLRGTPCIFNSNAGLNPSRGTVIVENTGNCFSNLVVGYESSQSATVRLAVSGAMTNGTLIVGYNGGYYDNLTHASAKLTGGTYTLDLMEGTTQRCERIAVGSRGVITGAYPSMIEVFGYNPMSTAHQQKHCVAGKVQGGVGFHMCGSGTLRLASGGTYNSTGDLAVSSGTLELESGVVWNKGKMATVTGTGTLKVNATGALGTRQVELFIGDVSDGWKLDIPAGCKLMVRALRDAATGRLYSSGVYGNAASGAPLQGLASHFTGNGTLVVARLGTNICIR